MLDVKTRPLTGFTMVALLSMGTTAYASHDDVVTTSNLSRGAITSPKLKNAAVTTPKIKNLAVKKSKIGGYAVTTPKIADGAVTSRKLSPELQSSVDINNGLKYLALAGGQCNHQFPDNVDVTTQLFYCDLSDNTTNLTDAYWNVDLPHGAYLMGIKMHSISNGGTTTCELKRGTNTGGVVQTVTSDSPVWGTTDEVLITHTVDNSDASYGVECFTGDNTIGAVGGIYIRYTLVAPL
jgi:hypothetical protein